MKKALLIQFDVTTGKRSGDVDPKDENLQCYGWQELDGKNSKEIRLVEDDRDLSEYKDVEGVTILEGKDEINNEIQKMEDKKSDKVIVKDKDLAIEDLKAKNKLSDLKGKSLKEAKDDLYQEGLAGIGKKNVDLPKV